MSDSIKHECGIAMLRLLKPLEYYHTKYGNTFWGLSRMYLLMEKQHNRGQDGAGLANIKFDVKPGHQYIDIAKSNSHTQIQDIFDTAYHDINKCYKENPSLLFNVPYMKEHARFTGELFLGHLRYGTFGRNGVDDIHPFIRENNWMSRSLVLAGNFNMTNMDEMLEKLISLGQHPVKTADTAIVLEKIGKFLDDEVQRLFRLHKDAGLPNKEISKLIAEELTWKNILTKSAKHWDGGYVLAGMVGHGDGFVLRDPSGIRPAFYYHDDEVAVVASERPVIMTAFNVPLEQVQELKPGELLTIKRSGNISIEQCLTPAPKETPCVFERIYFSRGTDADIYKERKRLGYLLCPQILDAVKHDVENTVFSYIPNTASVAFQGMMEGMNDHCTKKHVRDILSHKDNLNEEYLTKLLSEHPRREYIAVKDVKLRTFIAQEKGRNDMVAHVYDVTYGQVKEYKDNLVVIDDSIVRGTTLKESIIHMLDRLGPKRIVIASSAPQIRYPDCYGIDMARMSEFIAFRATMQLLHDRKMDHLISEVYNKCKAQQKLPKEKIINYVKELYEPFTPEEITEKITEMLTPQDINAEVKIIFQSIELLHSACPNHQGDWYFTGNYPTPGGNKVVNTAFINYIEGKETRPY